ncbi:unnamed protein product [Allacma fusca]|uniref:HMG box domain-containing protein n=1 Tax=Allacma fusca TaxID=39272 RepID=A0A8J2J9X6_9HEXA|nr:unnamed protein product [Allacma fusca]
MPKNKSAKPNAFILFVMERKKQLEQDGEQFSGLSDAVEKLGPEWKIMSKQHREPFEQKAKAKKAEILEKEQKRRVQISAPVYCNPAVVFFRCDESSHTVNVNAVENQNSRTHADINKSTSG